MYKISISLHFFVIKFDSPYLEITIIECNFLLFIIFKKKNILVKTRKKRNYALVYAHDFFLHCIKELNSYISIYLLYFSKEALLLKV